MKRKRFRLVCSLVLVSLFAVCMIGLAKKKKEKETVTEIRVLLSTDGDPMRKRTAETAFCSAAEEIPGIELKLSFVESDTLAFLKLLYADKTESYDIVGLGAASLLSASDQRLIGPLDGYLLRDDGLSWLNRVPAAYMEHAAILGKLYALPAQRSRLMLYTRQGEGISPGVRSAAEKPTAVPAARMITDMLMTGSRGEYAEQAERKAQGQEEDALIEAADYLIDTTENRDFLEKLCAERGRSLVFYENCADAAAAFLRGELDGIIMDEAYEFLMFQNSGVEVEKKPLLQEDGSAWPLQGYDLCLTSNGSTQNRALAWQLIRSVVKTALADAELQHADNVSTGVTESGSQDAEGGRAQGPVCFTSAYQTKVRLWTERMISEFLYGEQDPGVLLPELQRQINRAAEGKG